VGFFVTVDNGRVLGKSRTLREPRVKNRSLTRRMTATQLRNLSRAPNYTGPAYANWTEHHFSFLIEAGLRQWNRRCLAFVIEHYQPSESAHGIDHLLRVLRTCFKIAEEYRDADRTVLLIAAYFHDFISFPKNAALSEVASTLSADYILSIVARWNLSEDQKRKLHGAIACHSFSADIKGSTIESDILYDADKIDALGAVGLARLFGVSGSIGSDLYNFYDPFFEARELDDKKYALDHIYKKLLSLPEKMRTTKGREIANDRIPFIKEFLANFKSEILCLPQQ
jgi:uncharacterized protein